MADRKQDEYKSVKFYADNTTAKQAGFSKFEFDNDFYFCRYIDGKIAMLSQAYTSVAGRDNGIESVKKNEKTAKRFKFEPRGGNRHGFALKAGNGQEIAISPDYASLAQAEQISRRLTGKTKAKKVASKKAASKPATKTPAKRTAVAAAFTSADQRIENYKPLAFYKKHGGSADGFNSFEENGAYYFHYNEGGEIVLISESYTSKRGRDNGIASVKKNMKLESAYQHHKHKNGKHYFDLNAANHQEIATSRWYGSAAAATAGAAYLLGTRRRVARKTIKPAAAALAAGSVAAGASARAATPKSKPAPTKPKPVKKKSKPALAAGSVAVAALGASAAAAKTNPVKKAAVPVKAGALKPMPVAAPIAAAAAGTSAVAAAAIAATPKAETVVAAPVPAAAVAEGVGIWGWLKWVLMALIALLAMLFLFKACTGGDKDIKAASTVTTTSTVAPAAMVTCWNGSEAKNDQACPTKVTCWDESFATSLSACPVQPMAKDFDCWDGSKAIDLAGCPVEPVAAAKTTAGTTISSTPVQTTVANATSGRGNVKMSAPSVMDRICAPSSNPLFNVSGSTPRSVGRLGTNPQFGNSLTYTPDEFFRRLQVKYRTSPRDKSFLDLMAKSLGHGAFENMNASMFSNDTLPKGTAGLLGFGSYHALQFSALNVSDPTDLEAFKVRSANGTDVHFMKRCGNFMYVCQP